MNESWLVVIVSASNPKNTRSHHKALAAALPLQQAARGNNDKNQNFSTAAARNQIRRNKKCSKRLNTARRGLAPPAACRSLPGTRQMNQDGRSCVESRARSNTPAVPASYRDYIRMQVPARICAEVHDTVDLGTRNE